MCKNLSETVFKLMSQALVVLTTLPEHEAALRLAEDLVGERLAACVNILPPMTSVYEWKGRLEKGQEHLLLIKTSSGCYSALEARIRRSHPYELPEIIALPVASGLVAYLDWVRAQTLE
jgi:periplasmic divalent cation tolerance protein